MGHRLKAGDIFEFDGTFSQAQIGENTTTRSFSIAVSGGPVDDHRYGYMFDGPLFFDLATTKTASDKLAALLDHNDIAGYTDQVKISANQIALTGKLLDFGDGDIIAKAADQGFPWQASLGVRLGTLEQVPPGEKTMVNGAEITGPAVVGHNNTIRHISFTAEGADRNTRASVFSADRDSDPNQLKTAGELTMSDKEMLETLKAQVSGFDAKLSEFKASNDTLTTENTALKDELKAFQDKETAAVKAKREADVKKLAADLGVELSADQQAKYVAMDQAVFDVVRSTIPEKNEDDLMQRFDSGEQLDDERIDVAQSGAPGTDTGRMKLHLKAKQLQAANSKLDYVTAVKAAGAH